MNMYTKKYKKFTIVLVLILLVSFCCPKPVKAWSDLVEDIVAAPAKIFWILEAGLLQFMNNVFADDENHVELNIFDTSSDSADDGAASGDSDISSNPVVLSPENIIKGRFLIFNANIFEDVESGDYFDDGVMGEMKDLDGGSEDFKLTNSRTDLRNSIAGWYYSLRNLALAALLCVLVYVSIRMIISTAAQDKAKYKVMFKDWLVALCLLMLMHIIMIGTLETTSAITEAIGGTGNNSNLISKPINIITEVLSTDEYNYNGYTLSDAYAYIVVLAGVIGYTFLFAVKYLKREFTIIFLILLGPVSCITYPIDKISDGKAQAFNKWITEFVYQVLIQPFHLLLYLVLVSTAIDLADTNIIYALVCFAVILSSEKFVKAMFGFKDQLGSPLGAFAGGALASQLFNKIRGGSAGSKADSPKVDGKSEKDDSIREKKLKTKMPGAEEGSGTATSYSYGDDDTSTEQSTSQQRESTSLEESNIQRQENNSETGYGASAAAAYQNESDPIRAAEKEALEEQLADGQLKEADLTDEQKELLGSNKPEQQPPVQPEPTQPGPVQPEPAQPQPAQQVPSASYTPNEIEKARFSGKLKNGAEKLKTKGGKAIHGIREHRDKKLMAKYGTKNRALAAGRKGASVAKKTVKGATTLAGAALLGGLGFMFGQGAKGAALGAGLGATLGNTINDSASKTYNTAKEYGREAIYAARDEEKRREKRVEKMMKTPEQIEKASRSYSKRNNGEIATTRQLNQELAERAKFKETGLSDSQIDDAMEIYHNTIGTMGEDNAFRMAVWSTNESNNRSAEFFENPEKVKNMYDRLMRTCENEDMPQELADEMVRTIISNAASIHKVKSPAFKEKTMQEKFIANQANRTRAEGRKNTHGSLKGNKAAIDKQLELEYRLQRAGIKETDRDKFFTDYVKEDGDAWKEAKKTVGEKASKEEVIDELERRFEIKLKMQEESGRNLSESKLTSHIKEASKTIQETQGITEASTGRVAKEIDHRLQVKDAYKITEDSQISKIRSSEERFVGRSSDKNGARSVIEKQRAQARVDIRAIESNGNMTDEQKQHEKAEVATQADFQREFLASYSSKQMEDGKTMNRARKQIMKRVEQIDPTMSSEGRAKFARNVTTFGQNVSGVTEIKVD